MGSTSGGFASAALAAASASPGSSALGTPVVGSMNGSRPPPSASQQAEAWRLAHRQTIQLVAGLASRRIGRSIPKRAISGADGVLPSTTSSARIRPSIEANL